VVGGEEGAGAEGRGDEGARARAPAVRVEPRCVGGRAGPQGRHGVEVDPEAVVGQVLHVEERVQRLAIVRARRAVRPGRIAVVDVPHAVVAAGAAGGVRPVVDAVVIQVAVVRVPAILVVRGQLAGGRTRRVVVR